MPPHGCFPAASPAPSPRALPGYDTTTNGPFSPLVSQEGDGLPPLTVSQSAMLRGRGVWNIPLMRPSYFGPGQASCMLPLPGIINHFCCWLLPCSQIGPPSHLKGRLDLPMISNGFKWDCAQAIQSFSVSGVELATSKVY